MLPTFSEILRRLRDEKDGAAAIEAAIVFPILIMCLFGVFGLGVFLFGTHQAQRIVEETAREARVLNSPTEGELENLLAGNLRRTFFGTYQTDVEILSQYDGQYAELSITYDFKFNFPFLDLVDLSTDSSTQVKLRHMPI